MQLWEEGRSLIVGARIPQKCQELSKEPPSESPAAFGLALLPPTGPLSSLGHSAQDTSASLRIGLCTVHSSSVFLINCSSADAFSALPASSFFFSEGLAASLPQDR